MNVLFFDLKKLYQLESEHILNAVKGALESGHYIMGSRVQKFEEEMTFELDEPGFSIGCNSGTDALILPMLSSGVGPGDEVITVAHTAVPTAAAIQSTGATPVFIDIHPETWVMDVEKISEVISVRTKAIIPVHLYGNVCNIPALQKKLATLGKTHVPIIEDVAQAHGSLLNDRSAGTIADYGAFSFYPTKNLAALGDAGAVFTKSADLAAKLKMLRNYGQRDRYNAEVPRGLNSRLDEIQAAVLSYRLTTMEASKTRKANLMSRYREELGGCPVRFQKVTNGCDPAWHLGVIAVENQKTRENLMTFLAQKGVQTIIHYPIPAHKQVAFQNHRKSDLSITEKVANSVLSLPMNAILSDSEHAYVCEKVREFFGTRQ